MRPRGNRIWAWESARRKPVRPAVDRYVLELLGGRTFTKEDVFELLDGRCRLLPPLTHELAATASQWARLVRPVAEEVADRLGGTRRKRRWWSVASHGSKLRRRQRGPTGVTREFEEDAHEGAEGCASPMSQRMRALRAANREWERLHGRSDPAQFKRDVLPGLAHLTLRQLQGATGLSRALCSKIRRGDVVPHSRYWRALKELPCQEIPQRDLESHGG